MIDSETLWKANAPFDSPAFSFVAGLTLRDAESGGFDIGPDGMGYLSANSFTLTLGSALYSIDLTTGASTQVGYYSGFNGTFDSTQLIGLTVAVPEPQTGALMALGAVAMGAAIRRRRTVR